MPDLASARELAGGCAGIGVRAGRPTVCELTAWTPRSARAVGNALEVAEACEMLAGRRPGRLPRARAGIGRAHGRALRPGRRSRAGAGWPRRPSPPARRCARSSGWWRPRAAIRGSPSEPWEVLEAAPVVVAVPAPRAGVGRALRRARDRPRGDASRRRPRAQGGSDRPRRRDRRARQAGRRGRGRRGARACARPRPRPRRAGRRRGARRVRARRRPGRAAPLLLETIG